MGANHGNADLPFALIIKGIPNNRLLPQSLLRAQRV